MHNLTEYTEIGQVAVAAFERCWQAPLADGCTGDLRITLTVTVKCWAQANDLQLSASPLPLCTVVLLLCQTPSAGYEYFDDTWLADHVINLHVSLKQRLKVQMCNCHSFSELLIQLEIINNFFDK